MTTTFFFHNKTGTKVYYHDAKGRNWLAFAREDWGFTDSCALPACKSEHCEKDALLGVGDTVIVDHSVETWAELAALLDSWPTHTRITWAEVDERAQASKRAQAPEQRERTRERTPVSVILEHGSRLSGFAFALPNDVIYTSAEARRVAHLLLDAADYADIRSGLQEHLAEMGQILSIRVPVSPRGECLKGAIEHAVKDLIRAAGWSVRASDLEAEAERRYLALGPVTCEN